MAKSKDDYWTANQEDFVCNEKLNSFSLPSRTRPIGGSIIKKLFLYIATLVVCGALFVSPVQACENHPLAIPPVQEKVYDAPLEATGLYVVGYDTNHDGHMDFVVAYQLETMIPFKLKPFPLFYFVGVWEARGTWFAQKVYIDQQVKGDCRDIVLYWARH